MSEQPELAEEYSRTEKIRVVVLYLAASAAMVLISKLWLFPAIREFAASAHCREVLGISGVAVLFYGILVGMPVGVALIVGLALGQRGYRVVRDGQLPPVGEKVFRPTRITRGKKALLAGIARMLLPLVFVALAVWGVPQARQMLSSPERSDRACGGIAVQLSPSEGRYP
jgi:hypothetical protein